MREERETIQQNTGLLLSSHCLFNTVQLSGSQEGRIRQSVQAAELGGCAWPEPWLPRESRALIFPFLFTGKEDQYFGKIQHMLIS